MAAHVLSYRLPLLDINGDPVVGGSIDFFEPGGSATPKEVWSNDALTTTAGTSVDIDSYGMPENSGTSITVYGDGDYYVVYNDALAVPIDDFEWLDEAFTNAEIKTAYEANADTNALTDFNKGNITGIGGVTAGGTVNAITANFTPDVSLTDGVTVIVRAIGANTSATVTFSPDGSTAKNVRKNGNIALVEGDIAGAGHELLLKRNTTNDVWELLNPANPNPYLVYETEVTGAAVTSIDVTGLDTSVHRSYRVELEIILTSSATLYAYVNNDTTNTNYYSQNLQGDGATAAASRNNDPRISVGVAGAYYIIGTFGVVGGNYAATVETTAAVDTVSPVRQNRSLAKTASITDITQLTITSSVASSINIGSKIRIYRG